MPFPPQATQSREDVILTLVQAGNFDFHWANITSQAKGHVGEFQVFGDALKVEGIRVNVCAETQQRIADFLECSPLTAKLADLAWSQRDHTLPPFPRAISSSTEAMIWHSTKIDLALQGRTGLVQTVGKHWIIDNDLLGSRKAMNYGWHFVGNNTGGIGGSTTASGLLDSQGRPVRLIQGRGTAHDAKHVDYSQTCVLVSRKCKVDGQEMDLHQVLQNEELAPLVSHQGVVRVLRQPT